MLTSQIGTRTEIDKPAFPSGTLSIERVSQSRIVLRAHCDVTPLAFHRHSIEASLDNRWLGSRNEASVSEQKGPTGKRVVFFAAVGICVGILVGAIFGWQYAIVGLGVGLGPLLGGYLGNKKAREVDKYREELIRGKSKRKDDGTGTPAA